MFATWQDVPGEIVPASRGPHRCKGHSVTTTTRVPISDRGWYPRPQLMRPDRWWSLDGPWQFAYDDESVGLARRWFRDGAPFDRTIVVPFPPESPASGIGDTGPHAVLWYRRTFTAPVG